MKKYYPWLLISYILNPAVLYTLVIYSFLYGSSSFAHDNPSSIMINIVEVSTFILILVAAVNYIAALIWGPNLLISNYSKRKSDKFWNIIFGTYIIGNPLAIALVFSGKLFPAIISILSVIPVVK